MKQVRSVLFVLFFISGFCGLVYQVVWTRMAFAAFGIIMPVLSIVLSVFMLGLATGSAAGGKWIPALSARTRLSGAFFYGFAELMIGAGAFAVPNLFAAGQRMLLGAGETNSFDYLSLSAVVLAFSLFPWCFFMGTTFPFMMAYIREDETHDTQNFSFLYTANVLGAMTGTFLTAVVFIELCGFHQTLHIAATGNFCIALASAWLGLKRGKNSPKQSGTEPLSPPPHPNPLPQGGEGEVPGFEVHKEVTVTSPEDRGQSRWRQGTPFLRWILFSTGFCAMAMEVVWTRAFTPVLKTQVYSFALIVFAYLGATFIGSLRYRRHSKGTRSGLQQC